MSSPTQRSLKELRKTWPLVQIVERWNPFAKVRQDLFGFGDVIAVCDDDVLIVQTTSGSNVSARFEKLRYLPAVAYWLKAPSRQLVIHGWRKTGERGKRKLWDCRIVPLKLGPTGAVEMESANQQQKELE